MAQAFYITLTLLIGAGAGLQVAMLAAIGRERGSLEASWINVLGAFCALALAFSFNSLRGQSPNLPAPLSSLALALALALVTGVILIVSVRGLAPYFALTGLFGFIYLVGAGTLVPRIGLALFVSAVTCGKIGRAHV